MFILRNILAPLQHEFKGSRKGPERGTWFIYTLLAVITHFTSSRTSNLIRCLQTLFGFTLCPHRFYTFMASPKIPWDRLWTTLWSLIPPLTVNGRLLLALDHWLAENRQRPLGLLADGFSLLPYEKNHSRRKGQNQPQTRSVPIQV